MRASPCEARRGERQQCVNLRVRQAKRKAKVKRKENGKKSESDGAEKCGMQSPREPLQVVVQSMHCAELGEARSHSKRGLSGLH